MSKQNKAFTLVELIVVITILAILGTIAFISFQGYSRDSRDSVRISDMNNIEKAMELILLKGSKLPLPEDNINLTASGELIGYQGYVGLDSLNKLGVNNGGLDPLDNKPYTYVTTKNLNKYQILGFLEQDTTSSINSLNLLENTYSADYSTRFPIVKGNNLGVLLSSGSLEPVQVVGNDIDIILTSDSYNAVIDSGNIFTGTGGKVGIIESSYKYGVYSSCNDLLKNKKILEGNDGNYLINPNGIDFINVYCDMTTDGGGWTLFYANNGRADSIIKEPYVTMRENALNNNIKYDLSDYDNPILAGVLNYEYFTNNGAKEMLVVNRVGTPGAWGNISFSDSKGLNWSLGNDVLGSNENAQCINLPNGYTWDLKTYNNTNYSNLSQIMFHWGQGWGISHYYHDCNGYESINLLPFIAFYGSESNTDEQRARSNYIVGGLWGGENEYRYFLR